MSQSWLIPAIAMLAFATTAQAAGERPPSEQMESGPAPEERAVINFADLPGRIADWRAEGTAAILIRVGVNDWYRAEFITPCRSLPFTDTIGFVTDSVDRIDRFSSIIARGERCWFKTFTKADAPRSGAETAVE